MIGKSFENKNAESIESMGLAQVSGVNLISEVDHISRLTLNSLTSPETSPAAQKMGTS